MHPISTFLLVLSAASYVVAQQRRATIFYSTFNSHNQNFDFVGDDETFFYSRGRRIRNRGARNSPSLQVQLGGLDKFLVDDITGGFERYFMLPSAARDVQVRFSYNLTLSGGYESDEFSTVIVGIDGQKRHKVMTLYGNSTSKTPATSGMQSVAYSFGSLQAGTHRLYLSAFNNRKDAFNERTRIIFDNVRLTRHTIRPNFNTITLLETDFGNGQGRWRYRNNTFRNSNQKGYANGLFLRRGGYDQQGALFVALGGIDTTTVHGISGGWHRKIRFPTKGDVAITIVYQLIQSAHYENDEVSQVLCSVDGELIGAEPKKDFVAQIRGDGNGGGRREVGYNRVVLYKRNLSAGLHKITVGAYNNKKTGRHERTSVTIAGVKVVLDKAS